MTRENTDVVICIRDQAPAFDPADASPPDLTMPLEQRSPGGLGIYLIQQSVDQVRHHELPSGGNELILRKERVIKGSR
jgi:anti-sigma regulatory factor (Ser/Thr protein kinase)